MFISPKIVSYILDSNIFYLQNKFQIRAIQYKKIPKGAENKANTF